MTFGQLAEQLAKSGLHRHKPAMRDLRPNHLNPIALDAFADFYGWDSDSAPITRAEAMAIPAMARARHIICTPSRLPISLEPADYPADALIRQPDPLRTRAAVHRDTLDSLLFHGSACWLVTARYQQTERPRSARFIPLTDLAYDPGADAWRINDRPVRTADLIFFEGPHEGVLNIPSRALRAAVALDRAYGATAANPAVAVELHQTSGDPLSDTERTDLVNAVRTAIRTRGVVYTNEAVELRAHAAEAENLLISGRQAAAVDVARLVGLPAALLDATPPGSSGTYVNLQAKMREARDVGIDAYARAVTDRLSLDDILPRGVTCAHVWDQLLRADFADRMAGYQAALDAGIYTAAELRELERRGAAQDLER